MIDRRPIRSNPVTANPGTSPSSTTRSHRAIIAAAIVLFAVISAYLALVIVTRVDSVFLPGRQITLPGPVGILPGPDNSGTSGGNDPINILVLGLDRRPSEGQEPTRSDTVFVLRVDPKTDSAAILGIPRDLMVDIPFKDGSGSYQDRVNTVYVQGEMNDYPGGGIGLLKQVLENDPFGIKIDKYVIIDFQGFEQLIDALGGIEVDVPEEVYDPYYSETELPGDYLPQHFYPGKQQMDGVTALAYARIRFSSDDLDRIQRQQRVIFAAIDKAKSLNLFKENPLKLWDTYSATIETDINNGLVPGYALLANDVKDNLIAFSLGSVVAPYTTAQGAQVLVGDPEGISELVQAIFSDGPITVEPGVVPTPQPVVVQIQNGAGIDGLAADVAAYIIGKGYLESDVLTANAADGMVHERSEIIRLNESYDRNCYLIADWLGIPPANCRDATPDEAAQMRDAGASIVVILGTDRDFRALSEQNNAQTGTSDGG
jgi:LCP family protein required for cell wall assembly